MFRYPVYQPSLAGKADWKMFDLQEKVEKADLPALNAQATAFCFVPPAGGVGLPPLESLNRGVPLAVSGRGSIPGVCADAGSHVDPEKPEGVALAIDRLLRVCLEVVG